MFGERSRDQGSGIRDQAGRSLIGGRWLKFAAIATWLVCGVSPMLAIAAGPVAAAPALIWFGAFLVFGIGLLASLYRFDRPTPGPRFRVAIVLAESIAAIAMNFISSVSFGGTGVSSATLVIVAAQLPYVVQPRWTWSLIVAQTIVLAMMLWPRADAAEVLSFAIAIGGFQLFAAASSILARSEAAAREKLAAANAELHATRALLAETSRVEERLRISRDLHDTLGHHLTALSLQLDVASRISEGKPAEHIRQAHAITRLLLGDVRDVVSSLRESSHMDLAHALRALALEQARVAIHLDLPPALGVGDSARANALLRSVQEIITNTSRHASAKNLWIRLETSPGGITLHARDDGGGVETLRCGNGLTGMRERFEKCAGNVEFEPGYGTGFQVRGFMPTAAST